MRASKYALYQQLKEAGQGSTTARAAPPAMNQHFLNTEAERHDTDGGQS